MKLTCIGCITRFVFVGAIVAGADLAGAAPVVPAITTPRYLPPEVPASGAADVPANQLDLLTVEAAQGHVADAARRLDGLLRESPGALIPLPDPAAPAPAGAGNSSSTVSLQAWLELLPEDQKSRLAEECETQSGEAASRMLSRLSSSNGRGAAPVEPARFLSVVARYPFTKAADDATLAAARGSAELGDLAAAGDLIALASARSKGLAASKVEEARRAAGLARAPTSRAAVNAYDGALPFAAPWFASAQSLATERFIPTVAGETTFISTAGRVMAFKETGSLLWNASVDESGAVESADDSAARQRARAALAERSRGVVRRAPSYRPDVFRDDSGTPRVVVVRQPQSASDASSSDAVFVLRSFRAGDGRLLWSSDDRSELRGLSIVSEPAVAGRYVYALAVDSAAQADRLVLLAFGLTDGRVLWRCDAGSVARRQVLTRFSRVRDPVLDAPDPWQHLSPPGVSRDLVVVAPNCGAVIAVGRFDGRLRWLRTYDQAQPQAPRASGAAVGEVREALLRWTSTPQPIGDAVVIVAPLDTQRLMALDARSGRKLWHTDDLGSASVVGAAGPNAIVADAAGVTALDAAGGDVRWTWTAGPGGVGGPVAVSESQDLVFVPSSDAEIVTLSTEKGRPVASPPVKPPDMRAILKAETGSAALRAAGAIDAFTARSEAAREGDAGEKTNRPTRPPRSR